MMRDMKKLNFNELEKEAIEFITKNKFMALSTWSENLATVRMVSIISKGLNIYFMTLKTTIKFQQLKNNSNITFCIGNMQAEGTAEISCRPLEDTDFLETYIRCHENTFKIYGHIQDSIIIKIKPKFVSFWKYDDGMGAYKDCLDIIKQKAFREFYYSES